VGIIQHLKKRESSPALSYRLSFRRFAEYVFTPDDIVVVGRLMPPVVSSPVEKRMVVRARPFEASGRVLYPSWPIWVHAMIMMTAGYILERKSMSKLIVYEPEPGSTLNADNK